MTSKKASSPPSPSDGSAVGSSPFAGLSKLRDSLPPGPAPRAKPEAAAGPARAVLRLERKGHGGKEATVVEKLELSPKEMERWVKEIKQGLGCGGSAEGDRLVFQGDQRDRLEPVLARRGVRKIIRG